MREYPPHSVCPSYPLTYRPHIDGLRAIAVFAVILYHAQVPGFSGGYVGVDIFFVISGYLITTQLVHPGSRLLQLSPVEFYLRRARRILPAALLALGLTGVMALAILLPEDLARLGQYLAASAMGVTNIFAWRETNYFNLDAPRVALSHFWSLAVEEQFYLIYPLALLAIQRWLPTKLAAALLSLGILSAAACFWASGHRPTANFFLPITRAWEFLGGAIMVTTRSSCSHWIRRSQTADACAIASLSVIGFCIFSFGPDGRYPNVGALAPCVATMALIAAGNFPDSRVGRVLSLPPFSLTGKISYGLYLFHLPIFSFFTYYYIQEPDAAQICALMVVTGALAIITRKWVEEPIRKRTLLRSTSMFVVTILGAAVILTCAGLAMVHWNGLPNRLAPGVVALAAGDGIFDEGDRTCAALIDGGLPAGKLCKYGREGVDMPVVLLWGDSHAMMLVPVIEKLAADRHVQLYVAGYPGCRPMIGVVSASQNPTRDAGCARFNGAIAHATESLHPVLIILSGHWIDTDDDLTYDTSPPNPGPDSKREWALDNTLRQATAPNRSICVVLDVPTYGYRVPYAMAMSRRRDIPSFALRLSRKTALAQFQDFEKTIYELQRKYEFRVVDPKGVLCPDDWCIFEKDGVGLYGDRDHLALAGAKLVADTISPCFADIPLQ